MRPQDIQLAVSMFAGMAVGVLWPEVGLPFQPAVLYLMLFILLMSFLRIDFGPLLRMGPREGALLAAWTGMKLVALPLIAWGVTMLVAPRYALPVLLLSGVSTGVTAPFFAQILGADAPRVLQMVVATSLLVPFTLPALVKLLMGQEIDIPFSHMARMLVIIILVPFIAAALIRRFWPALVRTVARFQFPLSLSCFFVINMAVFANYSGFLGEHRVKLLGALAAACLLAVVYCAVGYLAGRLAGARVGGLTGAVDMAFINNVLIIVFASQFFGPETPLVAAMYMIPYFVLVPVLRRVAGGAAAG